MSRLSLSSLAVLSLLSLSSPASAQAPTADTTHAAELSGRMLDQVVAQAQANPPAPAPELEHDAHESPVEVGLGEVASLLVKAFTSRNWGLLACAVVLGAVYVVRRFLSSRVPWLRGDVAGVVLSVATATSLSLVTTLQAGQPVTVSLGLGALFTAAGASGLFSWGKKLSGSARARQGTRFASSTTH